MPARDQLGIRAERRPCPHVPISKLPAKFLRNVLLLGIAERPDFIALNPLARQIDQHAPLVSLAGIANLRQELEHGVKGHCAHAGFGT